MFPNKMVILQDWTGNENNKMQRDREKPVSMWGEPGSGRKNYGNLFTHSHKFNFPKKM